ncbi:Antifungal peptide [Aspergillus parasiticus SU-1]|uniref:Antifungal peptide n=4 Tax=Aspergillus subgen. Circumdati TaxID=2720871 RepID=A0A5N6DW62_ASPPA|nr:hypothetical protein BDV34DRAFT_221811 [Aspergillus parasiticus]KAB8216343.1 hypothetical protein BDV33DRAFT_207405 [Aspergillus novoparasiticus]KAE8313477.1 hypothetical protein BDV41DRAFT_576705 [Aspergillus transmontanensis]KJK60852.1 Antifungal peptide [Aspergillus parasiticus SU-1]
MRFSFLAALTLISAAIAAPQQAGNDAAQNTLAIGAPCKKDGSMGICEGGFCLQDEKADQGVCQQAQN